MAICDGEDLRHSIIIELGLATDLLAKISVENLLACLLVSRAGNLLVTCLLA